jgi:hypothetical protein
LVGRGGESGAGIGILGAGVVRSVGAGVDPFVGRGVLGVGVGCSVGRGVLGVGVGLEVFGAGVGRSLGGAIGGGVGSGPPSYMIAKSKRACENCEFKQTVVEASQL